MNCDRFETILESWLEGRLSDVEKHAADAHLRGCETCRGLVDAMRASLATLASDEWSVPAPDLASSILARTSGPACGRAQALLCDLVDGALGAPDAQLVGTHLAHCTRCAALHATIAWLSAQLPRMAMLEPDEEIIESIVAATSGVPERQPGWTERWRRGAVEAWRRALARPRFAWEAAYVATIVIVLLFGTSYSPFRSVPPRALAIVQLDPRGAAQGAGQHLRALHGGIGAAGQATWDVTGARAADGIRARASEYADHRPGMHEAWSGLELHWDDLGRALRSRNLAGAGLVLRSLQEDAGALWQSFRGPGAETKAVPEKTATQP